MRYQKQHQKIKNHGVSFAFLIFSCSFDRKHASKRKQTTYQNQIKKKGDESRNTTKNYIRKQLTQNKTQNQILET
jgi:lipoprotein